MPLSGCFLPRTLPIFLQKCQQALLQKMLPDWLSRKFLNRPCTIYRCPSARNQVLDEYFMDAGCPWIQGTSWSSPGCFYCSCCIGGSRRWWQCRVYYQIRQVLLGRWSLKKLFFAMVWKPVPRGSWFVVGDERHTRAHKNSSRCECFEFSVHRKQNVNSTAELTSRRFAWRLWSASLQRE